MRLTQAHRVPAMPAHGNRQWHPMEALTLHRFHFALTVTYHYLFPLLFRSPPIGRSCHSLNTLHFSINTGLSPLIPELRIISAWEYVHRNSRVTRTESRL